MDFGISHMVDLERLTVTGQLLGSPAYMAPEHVEGRPIDYRTDVFAAGIVLYQLTVGKLPFEGKNPHEVLKRIAECKFLDPRQANPRIGNRLGRIILRAMAAQPNDRYPAISEMVLALEAYLEESGIAADKLTSELARYFKAPAAYEQALKERLVDHLTRRGTKLLADGDQAPALDVFDRVLTIDPKNEKVLGILDSLNRRARLKTVGIAALAIFVIAGGAFAIHQKNKPPEPQPPPDPDVLVSTNVGGPSTNVTNIEPAPIEEIDAGVIDGGGGNAGSGGTVVVHNPNQGSNTEPTIDGGPTVLPPEPVTVSTFAGSEWRKPGGEWQKITGNSFVVNVEGPITIDVKNDCCETLSVQLDRGMTTESAPLAFRPAKLKPTCKGATSAVVALEWTANGKVERRTASLDSEFPFAFESTATSSTRSIKVTFSDAEHTDTQQVTVTAGQTKEVACKLGQ